MGKDQELLQAVKTEDLLTVQKLLQRPRPGKASKSLYVNLCCSNLLYSALCILQLDVCYYSVSLMEAVCTCMSVGSERGGAACIRAHQRRLAV